MKHLTIEVEVRMRKYFKAMAEQFGTAGPGAMASTLLGDLTDLPLDPYRQRQFEQLAARWRSATFNMTASKCADDLEWVLGLHRGDAGDVQKAGNDAGDTLPVEANEE